MSTTTHGTVREEKVFHITLVEKKEVLHEGSGVLQEIKRATLFDKKVPAVDGTIALVKAIDIAKKAHPDMNVDMLENAITPF